MTPHYWTVGELAKRTALTVRTLHYYDEIGLLTPTFRNPSGHRLYSARDLERLQQILSLRHVGISLDDIAAILRGDDFSPVLLLRNQIQHVHEELALNQRLLTRLEMLVASLEKAETVSAEALLEAIEVMTMHEKYYTPEMLDELKKRADAVGPERIREVEAEWPKLMGEVKLAMEQGLDPASAPVLALARRWQGLVNEFTGGNPQIEKAAGQVWKNETTLTQRTGMPFSHEEVMKMFAYIGPAVATFKPQGTSGP